MTDYWSKLKLNECWSEKQRFNYLMEKIETAIVGDSDLAETINELLDEIDALTVPTKTSELDNDSNFITSDALTSYISKSETEGLVCNDGSIDTTSYLSEHQDISGKIDRNELFNNGVFTTKKVNSRGSTAQIWNESDGGGTLYDDNTSGVKSFVGVNEGSQDKDIYVQIYSKTKSTNSGVRLNFNPTGAYYTVGSSTNYGSDDELVTQRTINELIARIESLEEKIE